ncbi:MAG: hypothetical protein K1X28_07975 [Parachlamydiales bacterium]|nr:hypothetical protein [Parachlamydiales bacterium]
MKKKHLFFAFIFLAGSLMSDPTCFERAARRNLGPSGVPTDASLEEVARPSQASYLSICSKELAAPYQSGESPSLQEGVLQIEKRTDSGMMNISSYPMIDSNKWDLSASATYWKAEQDGTEWASILSVAPEGEENFNFRRIDFNWNWGFKAGIGYNMMQHDEWDTQLFYSWFHTNHQSSIDLPQSNTPSAGILAIFTTPSDINGSALRAGKIYWKIKYNMFDWELGRGYRVSKHLSMRPHIGAKSGWIYQNVHGYYTAYSNHSTPFLAKNEFWGIGPSGGINTKWGLKSTKEHFISLLADFGGSWMWGHWKVLHKYKKNGTPEEFSNLSQNLGAFNLQVLMGLGWDTNFNNDRCHFSIRLGYEVQHWFNQLQFLPPGDTIRFNYDLTLQGGTFDVRLDF